MAKLTILRGISGSGKSTYARNQNAVVISRDNIRHGLLGITPEEWYAEQKTEADKQRFKDRENLVTQLQDASISAALKAGKDVIVDNTNIQWKFVKALAKIGYRHGAEVEVKVFDIDVDEAIWRDRVRKQNGQRSVGPDVIRKQNESFKKNKSLTLDPVVPPRPYHGTPGKPKAFLVDIDGTLAHMRDLRGPFEWHNVHVDDVDEKIAYIVKTLALDPTIRIIIMSGRDEVCRDMTEEWLEFHGIMYDDLFMRPQGDMRPDNIIKAELFDKYVRDNFDVQFVLDDRDQVVEMWRRMGLTCLQVAEGNF